MTADEFARLPEPDDGSKQELVRGVVFTTPTPSFPHGVCVTNIARVLMSHTRVEKQGRSVLGCGVITTTNPDTVRGPDLSYWSYDTMPRGSEPAYYATIAPDLIVEVLSPEDSLRTIVDKKNEYFGMGVKMLWIADPLERTASIYRKPDHVRLLVGNESIDGEDVLPGFQCRVADFFA